MIKMFHEAPINIMDAVSFITDGDYALVHMLESSKPYTKFFERKRLEDDREMILDNSAFELSESFNWRLLAKWIKRLEPTYYILPDVLGDTDKTIENFHAFTDKYPDLPGKKFAVIQGQTYEDIVRCYEALSPYADKIGICMHYPFYDTGDGDLQLLRAKGRQKLLIDLLNDGVIDKSKPHHLLGLSLPSELIAYVDNPDTFSWIDSLDSSCPVTNGIEGINFWNGLPDSKPEITLDDFVYKNYGTKIVKRIIDNIIYLRRMVNGEFR